MRVLVPQQSVEVLVAQVTSEPVFRGHLVDRRFHYYFGELRRVSLCLEVDQDYSGVVALKAPRMSRVRYVLLVVVFAESGIVFCFVHVEDVAINWG